ncbi:thiamine pyrophosphate-requiring protein [Tianweitania sediminis]|uniref:Thiamine pyrophosphate-requiring protein n=1 Tax=Tianweitania sediminis TaxID=1502156 RepID=A0A8J7RJC6_9HYPH|nr:thiamine pyrophosphate-requiring protein [Tianweitania sediminis]MBP0438336.1 thiamine pyrophosphate-requiring protein [Tianweitania sediminis]
MASTVADFMLSRLQEWGVKRIYGFPGDGINGLMTALDNAGDAIEFIQTRHEESAAFMAGGHAKYSGELGVCMATSGPGAIHLLNGLYDAKLDHQPVLAIVGHQARAALGGDYQQEVDLKTLFKDVASEYVHVCMDPAQMRHLVDRAARIALSMRTVTCIIVPNDVQELDAVEKPPREHGTIHSGVGYRRPRVVPEENDLRRAAEILNNGKKVAMLVGAGALQATDEVIEVAEVLGAGVAKALLGRAAVPDDLPFVTGQMGLLGTEPSDTMMQECDTLLMVGSSFPYSEFLPKEGQARGIQIDIDPKMLSIRYPMELGLVGDAALTLRSLLPYLKPKEDRSWRASIESNVDKWWKSVEKKSLMEADPINPELLFWELSSRLPENCIISADSGSSANWFARALRLRRGMKASLSGNLATMCPGVPYATAAKFVHPDRVSIAFVGDGAMQMLGINGLITIGKYWRKWSDPRLVIAVLNNQDLNQVTWEQRAMAGSRKTERTQNVPEFPYAAFAEMVGLRGIRVETPDQIGPAWDQALAADRPVVIDAVTDANVPTLPPHITASQAKSYVKALAKGDPNAGAIVWQTFKRSFLG